MECNLNIKEAFEKFKKNEFNINDFKEYYKNKFKKTDPYILDHDTLPFTDPIILNSQNLELIAELTHHKFILERLNEGKLPEELKELYDTHGFYQNLEGDTFMFVNKTRRDTNCFESNKIKREINSYGINEKLLNFYEELSQDKFSGFCYNEHLLKLNVFNGEYNLNDEEKEQLFHFFNKISLIGNCYEYTHSTFMFNEESINKNPLEEENIIFKASLFHEIGHLVYYREIKSFDPFSKEFKEIKNINKEECFADAYSFLNNMKNISQLNIPIEEKENMNSSFIRNNLYLRDEIKRIDILNNKKNKKDIDKNIQRLNKTTHLTYNNNMVLFKAFEDISIEDLSEISQNEIFNIALEVSELYKDGLANSNNENLILNDILNKIENKHVNDNLIISNEIKNFLNNKISESNITEDYISKVNQIKQKTRNKTRKI